MEHWLQSAKKGQKDLEAQLIEVDSDGNGKIDRNDVNNYTLAQDLRKADQLCVRFVKALQRRNKRVGGLWITGPPKSGKISCSHTSNPKTIKITAQNAKGETIFSKYIF